MTQQLVSMNADELIGTLMSPDALGDPYPIYERLREIAPNHLTGLGVRFVSTHDLCMELLKSKDFGQSFGFGSEGAGEDSTFISTIKESLILSNPPRHTRLRKLVSLAFSGRMIKELTPRIQERLDDLMDELDKSMAAGGSADLVKLVAEPLPALVLGEMLGARDSDRAALCEWEEAIANANKPILDGDLLARADWATAELHAYIKARVEERRENPGDDIISVLTRIESEGETLTEVELINVIWTIMAAGSQTTTTTLTTSMYLLLQDPETLAALKADPSRIPAALDEVMRYESPVQNTFMRIALRPTTLGGQQVAEGEHVVGLFASANRDPAAFDAPDTMNVDRPELAKSLAFGAGLHSCLGRALGRQQVIQAVETLLKRFPDLRLAEQDIIWRRLLPVRQLNHLYVRNGS
jgi:cytochrome P450